MAQRAYDAAARWARGIECGARESSAQKSVHGVCFQAALCAHGRCSNRASIEVQERALVPGLQKPDE
jgi:hypothetical protein